MKKFVVGISTAQDEAVAGEPGHAESSQPKALLREGRREPVLCFT